MQRVVGQVRVQDMGGGMWLVQADTDGDGTADFQIEVNVLGGHSLTGGDFVDFGP